MARNYTREQQRQYREDHGVPPIKFRKAKAKMVADRLLGKRKDTLFQTEDEWKWTPLKARQMGMSSYNSLLINNPRTNLILSGFNGV